MEDEEHKKFVDALTEDELKPNFKYMKKVVKGSKLINIWPKEKKTFWYHLSVWVMIVYFISFVIMFLIQIKMETQNMDSVTEAIDFVTVFISATFRFIYVYARGEKYLLLVHLIHTRFIHYPFFRGKKKTSLQNYYNLANRIILFYGCFTYFWIVQFCLMPLLSYLWTIHHLDTSIEESNSTETTQNIPYPVPMELYVPFDVSEQPANSLFYIYESIGFIAFGSIYVMVDSFWYMVILLTIGQFSLIKDSLNIIEEILTEDDRLTNEVHVLDEKKIEEVEQGLKKCVRHHQFTREVAHMIDNIFNPNILVDSLHAIISIAFILLDVTIALNKGNWNKVMYSLEYFVTSITHMFFFDWLGNELAVKEEELAEAIYSISWYRCPKMKIHLLLLIAQSRRPSRLTGGKMYKLSLEFFTSTVKAVFSYFTFLFQLRNGSPSTTKQKV